MQTIATNKMLGVIRRKLSPAAEAHIARRTASLSFSPEEANEIGRELALAAEAAADSPYRQGMRAASALTEAEARAVAEAEAALAAEQAKSAAIRRECLAAERELHLAYQGEDFGVIERAQRRGAILEGRLHLQQIEVEHAASHLGRVRGDTGEAAGRRFRAFIAAS